MLHKSCGCGYFVLALILEIIDGFQKGRFLYFDVIAVTIEFCIHGALMEEFGEEAWILVMVEIWVWEVVHGYN